MIIVGIDPGLQITGYGVINSNGQKAAVLEAGIIKTVRTDSLEIKLKEIDTEIGKIITQYQPDYVAIEELYSHYAHPKTAIIMAHARGISFLQAAKNNIPVISYSATRIKNSLTGNGRASKLQMRRMIKIALELKSDVESSDTADALAVALCHHNTLMGN